MAGTGSTAVEVYRWVVRAAEAVKIARETPAAGTAEGVQRGLARALERVRAGGDVGEILASERDVLVRESKVFANAEARRSSLANALAEMEDAQRMLPVVAAPEEYRLVDGTHRFRSHRIGLLPRDDARMFFAAHGARLLNELKARGTDAEKSVLRARRKNILTAERLYKDLQREALGIGDRGRALER